MIFIIIFISIIIIGFYFIKKASSKKVVVNEDELKFVEDKTLATNIDYYRLLTDTERLRFIEAVKRFLSVVKITGVDVSVEDADRVMIAASAVIPVFAFPDWQYHNLEEVLLYSDTINEEFQSTGEGRNIMGMVGSGYMNGKMLLSRHALREGFSNRSDKSNTAIHEFVHLIDKMDGDTDGLPTVLINQQFVIPWLEMIRNNMEEIAKGRSDINPYGITNRAEFFAVVSEYFFERPDLLQSKHPDIYQLLQQIFLQTPVLNHEAPESTKEH